MADIVQLKENGVLKYLKTHVKAVENLDATIKTEITNSKRKIKSVWTGGMYGNETFEVPYNTPTMTAVIIRFERYSAGQPGDFGFCDYRIEKDMIINKWFYVPLADGAKKSLNFANGSVTGNAFNQTDEKSRLYIVSGVWVEYE